MSQPEHATYAGMHDVVHNMHTKHRWQTQTQSLCPLPDEAGHVTTTLTCCLQAHQSVAHMPGLVGQR